METSRRSTARTGNVYTTSVVHLTVPHSPLFFVFKAKKSKEGSRGEKKYFGYGLSVLPSVFVVSTFIVSSRLSIMSLLWRCRENSRLAAEVYKDMPETSFTRTISNPEVVMKRRRQQKLEKRMQEFISSDGRPDSGNSNSA